MPFTFLVELLYKFKKEIFIAIAIIVTLGSVYIYHTNAVRSEYNRGYLDGVNHVYEQINNAPPKVDIKVKHDTIKVPFETIKIVNAGASVDTLYIDSTKTTYAQMDTVITTKDSNFTYKDTIHVGFTGHPFNTFDFMAKFQQRKYITSDTTTTIERAIVKDFNGLNYGISASANLRGAVTIGPAFRYKQVVFGPFVQAQKHFKPTAGVYIIIFGD